MIYYLFVQKYWFQLFFFFSWSFFFPPSFLYVCMRAINTIKSHRAEYFPHVDMILGHSRFLEAVPRGHLLCLGARLGTAQPARYWHSSWWTCQQKCTCPHHLSPVLPSKVSQIVLGPVASWLQVEKVWEGSPKYPCIVVKKESLWMENPGTNPGLCYVCHQCLL